MMLSLHLANFIILNSFLITAGVQKSFFISRSRYVHSKMPTRSSLSCNPAEVDVVDIEDSEIQAYLGPMADFDDMEAGCSIEELGIQVMVGPSLIGSGRGLFISILDEVDEVTLPAGTPICGYSKGEFRSEADGDKSVAYLFGNAYTGIIFEKKLMPLLDAIGIVEERINAASQNTTTSAFKSLNKRIRNKYKIADGVIGHKISYDESTESIEILPELDYLERYFIPSEESESTVWGPGRLGMYANDLAYYDGATEETYNRNSPELNVLQIAWRMELLNQTLVPTWPVVITLRDTVLHNREPMELGLQYSWRYWKSVEDLVAEKAVKGDSGADRISLDEGSKAD